MEINFDLSSITEVKESDNESNRIPSVGIRRNLEVGFDRPLLRISSFNKSVPGANFRGQSKPPIRRIPKLGIRLSD
jgi:hypothetical protein